MDGKIALEEHWAIDETLHTLDSRLAPVRFGTKRVACWSISVTAGSPIWTRMALSSRSSD